MVQTPGALALPSALPAASPALRACLFALSGARFAVDVRSAREVAVFDDLTAVPRAPRLLLGVANLRGTVVPIVDVGPLLDLPELRPARTVRTLVLRRPSSRRGRGGDRARARAVRRRALAGRPHRSARPRLPPARLGMDHLGRRDARPAGCSTDPGRPPGYARHRRARRNEPGMHRRDVLGFLTGGAAGGGPAKSSCGHGGPRKRSR